MRRRLVTSLVAALCAVTVPVVTMTIAPTVAHAEVSDERIAELSAQLDPKQSEKQRVAAVTALGRLNDKKALKPLVQALSDKSATVRAVAAVALGKLGHRAALPALRNAQTDDEDVLVRKRAKEAVAAINKANGLTDEPAAEAPAVKVSKGGKKAGFGDQPRALEARPEVFAAVKSATDDSPTKYGKDDKKTRQGHADIVKATMRNELGASPVVTITQKDAKKYGLDLRNIDLIITKLETAQSGSYIEIIAELRLAISDDRGKMLSFLTGGAKVQVKKAAYNASYLPQLRKEALENAVRGLFDKLVTHLKRGAGA
jgi:hypothetical protein